MLLIAFALSDFWESVTISSTTSRNNTVSHSLCKPNNFQEQAEKRRFIHDEAVGKSFNLIYRYLDHSRLILFCFPNHCRKTKSLVTPGQLLLDSKARKTLRSSEV